MSTKLEKQLAEVCDQLAALKADDSLEDLDKAAQQVVTLEAKRGLLETKVAKERTRLAAEEAEAKSKARRKLLESIAKQSDQAAAKYQELTEQARSLVYKLVDVLADREQVLSREAVGLESAEVGQILTTQEVSELLRKLEFVAVPVRPDAFGATWRDAVAEVCGEGSSIPERRIRETLHALAPTPKFVAGVSPQGLTGASPELADTARHMAHAVPEAAAITPRPTEAVDGTHQLVDLRS